MTQRSIRRAAERKARKEEERRARNKTLHTLTTDTAARLSSGTTLSEAKLAANQANAQLSTGPTSQIGKNIVSLNAVKTGLTGQTVLLPGDDAAQYQRHVESLENEYSPVGTREAELVQSIADTAWRLRRIPALELAIYAKGRIEFADLFEDQEADTRPSLIDAQTFLTFEKQLRNLHLQESRLRRRYEKERVELHQLQQSRQQREREALEQAAELYRCAKKANRPFHPVDFGFEFSIAQIEHHVKTSEVRETLLSTAKPRAQAA